MKKKILISASILVIAVAGAAVYYVARKASVFLSTKSPSGYYEVKIEENINPIYLLLYESEADFSIYENGKPSVKSHYFAGFDDFHLRFLERFPDQVWVNDTTLRFLSENDDTNDAPDKLFITNASDKTIKYLRLRAQDFFLILDIAPGQRFDLDVPHQKWQSWVEATGMFNDGTRINPNGSDFLHHDKLSRPLRYCISITNGGLVVRSPMMEGWNSNQPNTPMSVGCDR